ncbi:glucagon-like peptide 1 receptor [Argonauta hians]
MFLSSFQGFVVTILLCFVNYEVKTEIARFWKRLTMDHNTSQLVLPFTSLSEYFAKTRHSISEHKMANVEDSHRKLDQACKQKLKDGIKDQTNKQSLLSEDMPLNGTNGISKIQADEETRFPLSDLSLNSKGI